MFIVHACSVTQSCLTLGDLMDCSPPISSVQGLSWQEYWSGLPFPPPGDLPNPGIESESPEALALAGRFLISEPPWRPWIYFWFQIPKISSEPSQAGHLKLADGKQ